MQFCTYFVIVMSSYGTRLIVNKSTNICCSNIQTQNKFFLFIICHVCILIIRILRQNNVVNKVCTSVVKSELLPTLCTYYAIIRINRATHAHLPKARQAQNQSDMCNVHIPLHKAVALCRVSEQQARARQGNYP